MSYLALPHSGYRRLTWKNGLGFTDEIAIHPPGADLRQGNFLFRLSTAQIGKSSPFSVFPEHDRVLVLLEGDGLRLTHTFEEGAPEEVVDLPELEPYEFPGDVPSRCELTSGPVTDFSVFFRKGEAETSVQILPLTTEPTEWAPAGRVDFLFVARGGLSLRDSAGKVSTLQRGDALRFSNEDPPVEIMATELEAAVVHVSFAF